jgi:hypothetical protein
VEKSIGQLHNDQDSRGQLVEADRDHSHITFENMEVHIQLIFLLDVVKFELYYIFAYIRYVEILSE